MRDRRFPFLALMAEGATSAIDALQARTLRTTLLLVIVAANVCAALVAGAATRGAAVRARDDAARDGARGFVVYPWLAGGGAPLGNEDARAVGALPQVAGAAAHQAVRLPVGDDAHADIGAIVDGYDSAGPVLADADLLRGRWFSADENARAAPVVALGDRLAARVAHPGSPLGTRIYLAHRRFRVIGVYHDTAPGFHAVVPIETVRRLLGASPEWTDIVVRARDGVAVDDAERAVAARLGSDRRSGNAPRVVVAGADRLRAGARIVPFVSRITTRELAAIGLTLAGLALAAVMMRSVRDRTPEIGLRKVLGATRAAILLETVAESTTLATIGGAAGLAAGRVIAMLLAGTTPIPAAVSAAAGLTAVCLTIAGGAAFGAPPGLRAARLDALQALRAR
ncbi:MAG TPA: ABC transporter permease [Gemmatimonadaceae bacterium]|nr:ABC transporter permease [Gemmatimonadaceae bacterium]